MEITAALLANTAFSRQMPFLQLAWDSTSMGALKECPRKYYLSIIEGWTPRGESVHLTFGLLYHATLERYDHARASGADHEEATRVCVQYALTATWDKVLGKPWASEDPNKNRYTLVRTVIWYLEQFTPDPVTTVILANGKPAVELSFRMELGVKSASGEDYLLCGHLDRLGEFQGPSYVLDRKTTKGALSNYYFEQYSPHNQFSTYMFATQVNYRIPVAGLICDAAQIGATFSRFQRGFITRTPAQLDEWYQDYQWWLRLAETYAKAQHWPMNETACGNYGGCPFRPICSKSPQTREQWLEVSYGKRVWDPLQVRGDI